MQKVEVPELVLLMRHVVDDALAHQVGKQAQQLHEVF